jgi:DNA modification methylase
LIEGLIQGDCVEVMAEWPEGSVDAIVCDPPYGLEFMGREWDRLDGKRLGGPDELAESDNESGPQTEGWGAHASPYARSATPRYAGKQLGWKGSASMAMQEWHRRWALEAFRVLKPGGYLIAAGGTRTYHRMAAAVEDAGFEVRDMLIWGHAQGFPKSRDIGRDLDKMAGVERAVVGEQAMPGYARQNVEQGAQQRFVESFPVRSKEPATELAARYAGFGTALKPAWEPIVMARKPLQGTVAANVLKHGTGALNIDGTRIPASKGDGHWSGDDGSDATSRPGYEGGFSKGGRAFRAPQSDPAKRQGIVGTDLGFSKNDAETMHEAQRLSTERMESMGRWPANVVLTATEWYSLRNDVDHYTASAIVDYFETSRLGGDGVSRLRQVVRDHPSMGEGRAAEVLLTAMQREGVAGGKANGHQASPGVHRADEGQPVREGDGRALARLEGRPVLGPERLPVRGDLDANGTDSGIGGGDGVGQAALHQGAPAGDGSVAGSAVGRARGDPPPEWSQGRQPTGEPVSSRPNESFAGAPDDRPRTGAPTSAGGGTRSGERRLTVPGDLIPDGWMPYFRFSHETAIFDGGMEGVVGGGMASPGTAAGSKGSSGFVDGYDGEYTVPYGDTGTYSRFFLVPKAGRSERERGLSDSGLIEQERRTMGGGLTGISGDRSGRGGVAAPLEMGAAKRRNMHPTVKPVRLMRHLVRLVTPPGGVVLDPFLGSGTTAIAAIEEGFRWIGIEKEAEYAELAAARIKGWFSAPEPPVEPLEPEPPEPEPEVDEEPVREPFGPLTLFG